MKNLVTMAVACAVLVAALAAGMRAQGIVAESAPIEKSGEMHPKIPCIGRVQVLNGCGADGAANIVAEYLRTRKFDVKNIGNAPTSNYSTTLVVSRKKDSPTARQVADALGTKSVFLMRNDEELYDVTVYVGSDFKDLMR